MKSAKLFGKISILDICIIAALIFFVVFAALKFQKTGIGPVSVFTKQEEVLISFYSEMLPEFSVDILEKGQPVKEELYNADFGVIYEVEAGPSLNWVALDDGRLVAANREGYKSVKMTAVCMATVQPGGSVIINSSPYYVGQSVVICAGNARLTNGVISGISRKEEK